MKERNNVMISVQY